jgi:hypothetical protein
VNNDFENSAAALASQKAPQILKFQREDWTLFRTVEGLQQKAGVSKSKLRRLALKELADNGLDTGAEVSVGQDGDVYFVDDAGPGLDPDEVAGLFSIRRPMISTKLLRLPTRGALGNGLRVVAGAVLASSGTLVVTTRNRRIELRPERDGSTTVVAMTKVDRPVGTRVEISFGPALPDDPDALYWARHATDYAGVSYRGATSPHWYDAAQFHELISAAGTRPVRDLIASFDGCTGARAGEIVNAAGLGRAICESVTRTQANKLLEIAQEDARPVSAKRLNAVGPVFTSIGFEYSVHRGTVSVGPDTHIPFVAEAWARKDSETTLIVCVNRTPVTANVHAARDKRDIDMFGCGVHHTIAQAPKDAQFDITLNIITPFMPITSDGKAPNLEIFLDAIQRTVGNAVRKAHRPNTTGNSQKDIVLSHLDEVIAIVSGDGQYRFSQRQLLYQLRPIVRNEIDQTLELGNFTNIITDYENEHGEIDGMYREPRGSIYHPHREETITLGTLMVEDYERPEWTFNKVVYIEKEGFGEALKDDRWAERHDCMLMSSKGYATRAARDLVDKLAEHDEPVTIFCVHDADAYGTTIYQAFQEETRARDTRNITIVNLGLEPWEAIAMGLEVEDVEQGKKRKPVADYVREYDDGEDWEEWLQTHRVELNAMTTPQFIGWLDDKMSEHGDGKLIPPADALTAELDKRIEAKVRAAITERILREAGLDDQVARAIGAIEKPSGASLAEGVKQLFEQEADREWRDHIEAVANLKI